MSGLTIPFFGIKKQYNNIRQEILDATDEVYRSGQVVTGNNTIEFESWLADKNKMRYAATCHSGTQALEIIAAYYFEQAMERGINQPVAAIPTYTFPATANAFIRAGWDIVFMDCNNVGVSDFTHLPKINIDAIVLIGMFGHSLREAWIEEQRDNKRFQNTLVIEDAAQHWLSNNCKRVSENAAISFDPTKNLNNYSNGGAIVTNNSTFHNFALSYRNNSQPSHNSVGTNSKMSEVDCAQMLIKTRYLQSWQDRRSSIADYWASRLRESGITTLINSQNIKSHGLHKFVIEIDQRHEVREQLKTRKIESRIHYKHPLHEQGVFRSYTDPGLLSNASALSRRVLSIPFYPELTDLEVEYIVDQLIECVSVSSSL